MNIMNCYRNLILTALFLWSSPGVDSSIGLETTASMRASLSDEDFKIDIGNGLRVNTSDYRVRIADFTKFPALAGHDVQTTVMRVSLMAGKRFLRHFHPRSSETLNALRGSFNVSFQFEGLDTPRIVSNTIHAGQSTVFPHGLVHDTTCVAQTDCVFLSVLNSADPGFVRV